MKVVSCSVPKPLASSLWNFAAGQGKSRNQLMREILEAWADEKGLSSSWGRVPPRRKGFLEEFFS